MLLTALCCLSPVDLVLFWESELMRSFHFYSKLLQPRANAQPVRCPLVQVRHDFLRQQHHDLASKPFCRRATVDLACASSLPGGFTFYFAGKWTGARRRTHNHMMMMMMMMMMMRMMMMAKSQVLQHQRHHSVLHNYTLQAWGPRISKAGNLRHHVGPALFPAALLCQQRNKASQSFG